jgi:hypothetical protein
LNARAESWTSCSPPEPDLRRLLQRRLWTRCEDPFPHLRAEQVFTPEFHQELTTAFAAILAGHPPSSWPTACFRRNMVGYDAAAADLNGRVGWPFSVLVSKPWNDLFARLFEIQTNRCIGGALHHHEPGSRDGYIHHDLCTGWFVDHGDPEQITLPNCDMCSYCYGPTPANAGVPVRETVRGVAIIYYLNNADWAPGDGGETGLYRRATDALDQAAVNVPPINNSLLAFECTPRSFHTFRTNRQARDSVIVWTHRDKPAVIAKWGAGAITPWR